MAMSKAILVGLAAGAVVLIILGPSRAQTIRPNEPQIEEVLRQHLRKLDRWGVLQLLYTEGQIDSTQKQRAGYSAHPEELSLLAEDEDSGVRFYVAVNRHTPLDVRLRLVYDPSGLVRGGVASGLRFDPLASEDVQKITEKMALQLVGDPLPLVRLALAQNEDLPPAAFDGLAHDPDPIIRRELGDNLKTPQPVLSILAQDTVAAVQIQALKHRNLPVEWLERRSGDPSPLIRVAVCENINTPLSVLERLAGDADPLVRKAVASHAATSLEMLRKMVGDNQVAVVLAVASHPHADRELLVGLVDDPRDIAVRQIAQERLVPLLRREIREDILERWENK